MSNASKSAPIQILYEDADIMAILKPSGLSTESGKAAHPSAENEAMALYQKKLRQEKSRLPVAPYLRAVHRLDRASSGVLLLAKSKSALSHLMAQFEQKTLEKTYLAVTEKRPSQPTGTLSHWLCRDETGRKALVYDHETKGAQHCQLDYRTIQEEGEGCLLEIRPRSGRFHQIRAQLAHIGCPIVGDVLYGAAPWREHEIKLHASALAFDHPRTGERKIIQCDNVAI
jgi:23S rRNA pseudouridine1911/1915/1917 synthase